MPRWIAWIAGVIAVRAVAESVSVTAAVVLAAVLLLGYWGYRLATAPSVGETRARAAQRELRHIGLEVGDAILGWALIFLLLFAVIGLIVTWPPGWKLIAVVAVLAIVAPVVLIVSILGASTILDRIRMRTWTARREQLEDALDAWERYAHSTRPAEHALVEQFIRTAYARRRGLKPPEIHWAGSPPEFVRLLSAAAERPRLRKPPPSWFSLLPLGTGYFTWRSIWTLAGEESREGEEDQPSSEIEAALAAVAGTTGIEQLVEQTSCFAFRTGLAVVLERPTEIRLRDGVLHSTDGPSVHFPDGWSGWALDGVPVPAEAVEHPDTFDPQIALTHPNVEVRRVLLTHLGWDRVVSASGLTPHAEDEQGRLWQLPRAEEEPVLLLEVENATVETDGTRRRYFLRVPPEMRSPREATAWTFGLPELEYAPDAES